jgi:hypothetical protein
MLPSFNNTTIGTGSKGQNVSRSGFLDSRSVRYRLWRKQTSQEMCESFDRHDTQKAMEGRKKAHHNLTIAEGIKTEMRKLLLFIQES